MVGYAHVRAGHGAGQGHAAEEDSGSNRLYCDSELHSGLEMIWRLGLEEEDSVARGDCATWRGPGEPQVK
jgi:hypothetical protein